MAANYSDGIILGSANIDEEIVRYCTEAGLPILPYEAEKVEDGSYIEDYNSFYDSI